MAKHKSVKLQKKTGRQRTRRKVSVKAKQLQAAVQVRPQRILLTTQAAEITAQTFTGVFRFPGKYAFLEKYNIADYALLQSDDPFTGVFNEQTAENTCVDYGTSNQDGDPAILTGKIITCDVEGRHTPVLFIFH
jgi:hypothetical protein